MARAVIIKSPEQLAKEEMWRRGDLRYKLDANQLGMYETIFGSTHKRWVLNCSRRLGKSYLLCVIACEQAIRNPKGRINYAAPTGGMVKDLLAALMEEIISDAPPECKPRFDTGSSQWRFPNGAYVTMKGCEDEKKANRLRGPAAYCNLVDEAGFIPIISYVLTNVLNPQLLTTEGFTIVASTPPLSLGHEYLDIVKGAKATGTYIERTLYDNPRLTQDIIDRYIRDDASVYGATPEEYMQSNAFKREFLAMFVQDEFRTVVPEWGKFGEAATRDFEVPAHCFMYEGLDYGLRDGNAAVFAFYDFNNDRVCVQEAIHTKGKTTKSFVEAIRETELKFWPDRKVYRRVADPGGGGAQLIMDMQVEHQLQVVPTRKDDKKAQINRLRQMLANGRLWIHPRCKKLTDQLRDTVWREDFLSYERDKNGHGDLVDALVYLLRNVDYARDPNPKTLGYDPYSQVKLDPEPQMSKQARVIAKAFGADTEKSPPLRAKRTL